MTTTQTAALSPAMVGLAIYIDLCPDATILGFSADLSHALVRIEQRVYVSTGKRGSKVGDFVSHISDIFGADWTTWRDGYPVMLADVWAG